MIGEWKLHNKELHNIVRMMMWCDGQQSSMLTEIKECIEQQDIQIYSCKMSWKETST